MTENINPFHDLYLTEAIGADSFVNLFSPMFMSQGTSLYQPGNVVLKGLQGSGKTMLLSLLKPEIRMAYHKQNIDFPVPKKHRKYISGGINLRKSGVAEFAQLLLPDSNSQNIRELVLYFGDFINYWVVQDLITSIEAFFVTNDEYLANEIGINLNIDLLNNFSRSLSEAECWMRGLKKTSKIGEIKDQIKHRLFNYRNYINLNQDDLPSQIKNTKTVIGEPISFVADLLRESGIIEEDTNVFIRIDQYEELPTLDYSGSGFGGLCQQLIHKALSSRSGQVSYRIGTRQYAWPDYPNIYATNGSLELKRDYSVVNIDEKLRRSENRRTWLFPELAEDVFQRRLVLANYKLKRKKDGKLLSVFGKTLPANDKAKMLVASKKSRISMLRFDEGWPGEWKNFLKDLATTDPLAAKLGESWARQKDIKKRDVVYEAPLREPFPWDKPYWKKERLEQALTQIASRNKQQLIWQGKDDIIGLSGGNILVFLFICQHIWDAWLRDTRSNDTITTKQIPEISREVQSIGILNASEEWQKKPIEGKQSKRRYKVIQKIGERYYRLLIDDLAMSYPGRNGFSISIDDIDRNTDVADYLKLAVDYGDFYEGAHTSKSKGEKRKKYYLAPILCPAFRITYKHTKEPEYIRSSLIRNILSGNNSNSIPLQNVSDNADKTKSPQLDLYRE